MACPEYTTRRSSICRPALAIMSACMALALVPEETRADTAASHFMAGYVEPATRQFTEAADATQTALARVCSQNPGAPAATLDAPFRNLVTAWSALVPLRFGPLVHENRFERLYFWPDPRGLTARQVTPVLTGNQTGITDATIASHSVAMQGLPALELAIYGSHGITANPQARSTACAYALAVAANVQNLGRQLEQQWAGNGSYGRLFAAPGADNPVYRSLQEVRNEVVKAVATGIQFLSEIELTPVLGPTPEAVQPRRAPFWRSGNTLAFAKARVLALRAMLQAAELPLPDDAQWAAKAYAAELERAASALGEPGNTALQNLPPASLHQRLVLVGLQLHNARDILIENIAPAAGVTLGFNALDGD